MEFLGIQEETWKLISIPFTCAFVGWITNYVAVKMIFHPLNFIGWGILGWQGIIPKHALKMSRTIAHVLTSRLVSPHELFERVDPNQILVLVQDVIDRQAKALVEDVLVAENPKLWKMLPKDSKQILGDEIKKEIPKQILEIYHSFGKELDSILELDEMIRVSLSGPNTRSLIEMFQRCGGPEFSFIIRSGIYFGFLIGCLQVAFFNILNAWWTFPIMGVVVGYYTNWLAILMIFRPLEAKKFGFFTYQGLFLKRQKEVSGEFASVIASRVINPENLVRLIFLGKGGDLIIEMIMRKTKEIADAKIQERAPFAPMLIGKKRLENLKEKMANHLLWIVPEVANKIQGYIVDSIEIEDTLSERLAALPKPEFEDLLHSVFKEDELTLIILGAILGGFVGVLQAIWVF